MRSPPRSRANVWLVVGLCALLIGVVAFFVLQVDSDSLQRDPAPQDVGGAAPVVALETPAAEAAKGRASPAPVILETAEAQSAIAMHGRVVDDSFGIPVLARIEADVGSPTCSDEESGEFFLSQDCAGWTKLRAFADGYEEALVESKDFNARSGVKIRLRGARFASVIVQYADGTPAIGVPVTWRHAIEVAFARDPEGWIDSRAPLVGEVVVNKTDVEGLVRLLLAAPAIAIVEDPRTHLTQSTTLAPGEDKLIVLPEGVLTLRFVDEATRAPLPALEIDTWRPREVSGLSELLVSDANGEIKIAPTSYPVWLRRPGSSTYQSELIPMSSGATRCGIDPYRPTMIRIDAPETETILVGVRASKVRVRLIDEESGKPIDADVRVCERRADAEGFERSWYSERGSLVNPRTGNSLFELSFRARHGELGLPIYLSLPEDLVRGIKFLGPNGDVRFTLVLIATGYRPYWVHESSNAASEGDGTPVFKLRRAIQRKLRLRRPDGSPYASSMALFEPDVDCLCLKSRGERDGLYGPFDWCGGPVTIGFRADMGSPATIPANELAANDVVNFTFPLDMHGVRKLGSIVVEGIPASASRIALIAASEYHLDRHPDVIEPGRCRFLAVPAGDYAVGPPAWARGAPQKLVVYDYDSSSDVLIWRDRGHCVRVKPGETTVVPWDDSWARTLAIEGQVRILGPARVEPFLVPYYGEKTTGLPQIPGFAFDRHAQRIALDRDGKYQIGPDESCPSLIAICVADETFWADANGFHVLEVIKPGESIEIPTGSIELVCKANPTRDLVRVTYELPAESMRYLLSTSHTSSETSWRTDRVLRLDGIPLHVKRLALEELNLPVGLEAGKLVRVEVDLAKLRFLPSRRR
ncbi:MAG TPA: hypothetical protein VK843_19670 [Planctomycetota bacterium]|nr:hypothetical protein [Planctomycetota bacterium]